MPTGTGRARGRARGRVRDNGEALRNPGEPINPQVQNEPQGATGGSSGSGRVAYRGTGRSLDGGDVPGNAAEPPIAGMSHLSISGNGTSSFYEASYRVPGEDKTGLGTPITLSTNYFRLMQAPDWHVYQYHVDFNPPVESKRLRTALLFAHGDILGPTKAFDGMVLFLRRRLPDERTEVYSQRMTDGANIQITIKLTAELPPNSPLCLQVYGVILRKLISRLNFKQIGRNYYNETLAIKLPQHRLQVLPGYIESIQLYETAPLLNLDISTKILSTETVLDRMYYIYKRHETDETFKYDFTRQMVGQIVMTRYNNKTYRVMDIEYDKNPLSTFTRQDGSEITFKDYFQQQYGVTVTEDTQYLLVSKSKDRIKPRPSQDPSEINRRAHETVLLVPEFCVLTGLGDMNQDRRVMQDLAQYTRPAPNQRARTLVDFVQQISSDPVLQEELQGWDIQFSPHLMNIQGRRVQKEKIRQAGNVEIAYDQDNAEWSSGMRGKRMIQPIDLTNWLVLFCQRNGREAWDFIQTLKRVGPPMGMNFQDPKMLELHNDRNDSYLSNIRMHLTEDTQLVMCIVPTDKKDRYDAIKKFTCCDHPVPSQVIVHKTIRSDPRKVMSVATKVAIQLNCKLGGEVWTTDIPVDGMMVIGIDVYHDTVKKGRSVAGFIASMNRTCTRYYSRSIFQSPGEELVDKLGVCMVDALKAYHGVNNTLPKIIMVYRDGVGDGQLEAVGKFEVPQIARACQRVGGQDYKPKYGFVVVKKRISTRFFARSGPDLVNPPPGTVVDTEVTKREWFDFFMVSQSVRQGTVTPTHYNVIKRPSIFDADKLQRLTYKLCHLYYNWPGTIRVPAPCQYAHKLAYLVGQSIHREPSLHLSNRLYFL